MRRKFKIFINGREYDVEVEEIKSGLGVNKEQEKTTRNTVISPDIKLVSRREPDEGTITAPMSGKIVRICVGEGEKVEKGDTLLILEAMKMENEIASPTSGTIQRILVGVGDNVNRGDAMVIIK